MILTHLKMLAKIADKLDEMGLYSYASKIDDLMYEFDLHNERDLPSRLDFPHSQFVPEDEKKVIMRPPWALGKTLDPAVVSVPASELDAGFSDEGKSTVAPVKKPLERVKDSPYFPSEETMFMERWSRNEDLAKEKDRLYRGLRGDAWAERMKKLLDKQEYEDFDEFVAASEVAADTFAPELKIQPDKKYYLSSEPLEGGVKVPEQWAGPARKPFGLWYGIGNSWLRVVHPMMTGAYLYELETTSAVLKIRNVDEVRKFTLKYGAAAKTNISDEQKEDWLKKRKRMPYTIHNMFPSSLYPDWSKVAQDYAGLEINPFIAGDKRDWYDSWEVASGCIWRPEGVSKLTLVAYYMNGKFNSVKKDVPIVG